jgi:hypothetical protein
VKFKAISLVIALLVCGAANAQSLNPPYPGTTAPFTELSLVSASTATGAIGKSTTVGVDTNGATSVWFHVSSAATSSSVAFQQSIDGSQWYTSVTTTTGTAAGELWACPATLRARFYVNSKSGDGVLSAFIATRSMPGDPVGTACHRMESYAGFTVAGSTGVVSVAGGKTATVNNTMTLAAGADSQTYTFPSTSATMPGIGLANAFTAANTFATNLSARHILGLGTAPTTDAGSSTCGTTAPSIAGKDTGGQITVGSVGGTVCHVNFGTAFTNAPACVANAQTATNLKVTTTTAAATITGTLAAAEVIQYVCIGY